MNTSNNYQILILRTALSVLLICILFSDLFAGIFVSVTGDDITGNGTILNPFRSLSLASRAANPGDTIFMRGGTYITRQNLNGKNGSANQKITVMPYNNETVILDGTLSGINLYQAMLSVWKHYYTIKGIKIINSPGYGFYYAAVNNLTISGCEVYNSQGGIVRGWGNNDTIENCIFRNNVLYNKNAVMCKPNCNGGWFEGVACGCDNTCTIQSRNLVIRNNKVSRTWGEAIYVIGCLNCIVENNEIFDNFSVNLGIGKSRNIIVRNNYIYTTNDSLNRPDMNNRANAIYLANEMGFSNNDYYVDSIVIANNIIAGCRTGIRFWRDPINASDSNTYSHVGIYYNVFSDLRDRIINIDSIPLPGMQPQGCRFINNIAFSAPNASIIRNMGAWTVTNNNWVNTLPVFALPPSNFIGDPSMFNPVNGGSINGFKLQPQSACAGKAIPVENVQTDFWGTTRDPVAPTVGVFEIVANPTITPPADPEATLTQPTCDIPTGTIAIIAVAGLEYSFNGSAYGANTTFAGLPAGTYTVVARRTDDNTCISRSVNFVINAAPTAVIKNVMNDITFYPNPVVNILTIETKSKTQIEIFNIEGQIITRFNTNNPLTTIDVNNFSRGVYILKAITYKGIATGKLIKQ